MRTSIWKWGALSAALALNFALAPAASAQFFGQFVPLHAMPEDAKSLGLYLGSGGGHIAPTADFRVGYSKHGSMGLQASVESKIFGVQADVLTGLLHSDGDFPFELGGQLAGGFITGNGETGIYVQGVPVLSAEFDAGNGQSFAGWAGLGLRVSASNKHVGSSDGIFRVGGRFAFSSQLGLSANLEDVGGGSYISVGADYRFGGGNSNKQ